LLAEVVVWRFLFVEDAHATAMLPHTAFVALYEQASSIITDSVCHRLDFVGQRRAGVLLVATDAASNVRSIRWLFGVLFLDTLRIVVL